jgi:hypothetical protein
MLRRATAVVFLLVLTPALVRAQETMLKVSVQSADVHKGPSVVTPVIGQAPRGTALTVSQNLGSWVKVPWPAGPDGVGYVHVTTGQFVSADGQPLTGVPPSWSSTSSPAASTFPQMPPSAPGPAGNQMRPRDQGSVMRPSHVLGLGGLVASPRGFGVTARVWANRHIAIPLAYTRDTLTNDLAADRVTSTRLEWGLIYSPVDHLSDYVWFRPYVGSVASYGHQTMHVGGPAGLEVASDNGVGYRIFGGSELTFASVPWVGVSFEVGYRRFPTPFVDFETKPLSVSLAGHWYVK